MVRKRNKGKNKSQKQMKPPHQAGEKSNNKGGIRICGFRINGLSNTQALLLLASLHIVCAMTFAALQEKCFGVEGFKKYKQLLTVLTTLVYCLCALIERYLTGDMTRQCGLWVYTQLSVLTFSGMYTTNQSLAYLSYPARIVFKSGKPIPTMGIEKVYGGRSFSRDEYISVLVLTCGIVSFALGESTKKGSSEILGFVFIAMGVLLDSLTSNFEKKRIFSGERPASHAEVMFYAQAFGLIWAVGFFVMDEAFWDTPDYLREHPELLGYIGLSAVGGYFSVSFVLLMIKHFGPTYAECVKGCRKVFSILFSFMMFRKPDKSFTMYHFGGILFFCVSLGLTIRSKQKKSVAKYEKLSTNEDDVDTPTKTAGGS